MLATLSLAFPLALCAPQDPLPTVLVRSGAPLPGLPGSGTVSLVGSPRSTPDGEFGCGVVVSGGTGPGFYSNLGGTPSILVSQQGNNPFDKDELQLVDGEPVYVADLAGPCGGRAIWQDTTSLLCDDTPSPVPEHEYVLEGTTRLLGNGANGEFFVHVSIFQPFASSLQRILLRGPAMTPVLLRGDSLPGLNHPVGTVSIARSSPRASHWAAIARLDNPNTQDDPVLVVDGTPPLVDGLPVRRGQLVAAASGSAERWFRLYDCAVSEAGSWMVHGRTNGLGPLQTVLMRDGEIALRQGDVLDGVTLGTQIQYAGFGADGREILLWSVALSATGQPSPAALFVDRKRVLTPGGAIDLDGDGAPDPGWSVVSVTGTVSPFPDPTEELVDIDEDGVLRASGLITNGSVTNIALIELRLPIGEAICQALPNSTGLPAELTGAGTTRVAANAFELRAAQLPPGEFGYFLVATDTALVGNPTQPNLCVGGSIGRVLASLAPASPAGTLEYTLDLTALPQPNGTVAVQPGETWYFQCWFRDGVGTSDFSSGLGVTFR